MGTSLDQPDTQGQKKQPPNTAGINMSNNAFYYNVMMWSGGFPDSAEYKLGKHPTCTPSTVSTGTHRAGSFIPEPSGATQQGAPSARLRERAHRSHIISRMSCSLATLDNPSPTGSPLRNTNTLSSKKNIPTTVAPCVVAWSWGKIICASL